MNLIRAVQIISTKNLRIPILMLPFVTWFVFLCYTGSRTSRTSLFIYVLLCPLLLYLYFFISKFISETYSLSNEDSNLLRRFRVVTTVFLIIATIDSILGIAYRIHYESKIVNDWRYNIFVNGWLRKGVHIPFNHGSVIGVFQPNTKSSLLNSEVTINKYGFRSEFNDHFPSLDLQDTFNVLCLGGSVMFGMTVDRFDKSVPDMLQKRLYEEFDIPIRVFNGAIPGWTLAGMNKVLKNRYKYLDPKIVFFYEAINTLAPNQFGKINICASSIYTVIRNRLIVIRANKAVQQYSPNNYGRQFKDFIANTKQIGATPVLITFAMPYTENDSIDELRYWDVMQNGQATAYAAAVLVRKHNEETLRIAKENNIPIIDTSSFLNGKPQYFIDLCHLTQEGSQILANLMADKVRELLD